MTVERHDADMFIDSITPRDLDSLSMLLSDPAIPLEERVSMGPFATHLLRAELHPASVGDDAELLALLLARWDFSLQDRDADIDDALEAFEMQLDDASWVLGQSLGELRAGIARLSSSGVISTTPRGDVVLVTFKPVLDGITSKIEQRVYRDFYSRQGRTLHELAEHHLVMIVEHLEDEEARVDRCLPGLKTVRENLASLRSSATLDQLMSEWRLAPRRMYDWLDRLAAVETELAITTGYHELGLRRELQARQNERIWICSSCPPASQTDD